MFRLEIQKKLYNQKHSVDGFSIHSSYQALASQSHGQHNLELVTVLLQAGGDL